MKIKVLIKNYFYLESLFSESFIYLVVGINVFQHISLPALEFCLKL